MTSDFRRGLLERIRLAESWANDKSYARSVLMFREIEVLAGWSQAPGSEPRRDGLSERELRWVLAHHAAVLCEQNDPAPFAYNLDELGTAETLLRAALGVSRTERGVDPLLEADFERREHLRYSWAWARLGEVFRQKGNLPAIGFRMDPATGLPELRSFAEGKNYVRSKRCFDIALTQDESNTWALAHYGALLVNARRVRAFADSAAAGRDRLRDAIMARGGHYPWAAANLGAAHFSLVIRNLARKASLTPEDEHSLLVPFYLFTSQKEEPGGSYADPVQPGAVTLDLPLALTYDLLDALPPHPQETSPDYLRMVQQILGLVEHHIDVDHHLPASEALRIDYLKAYVEYLLCRRDEGRGVDRCASALDGIGRWAVMLLENDAILSVDRPLPAVVGSPFLIRVFDTMMIVLKTAAILGAIGRLDSSHRAELRAALEGFSRRLDVVKGERPGELIDRIAEFARRETWFCAPVWTLHDPTIGSSRADALGQILKIKGSPSPAPAAP